jgi:hypothetical protein
MPCRDTGAGESFHRFGNKFSDPHTGKSNGWNMTALSVTQAIGTASW